ncbi:NAD(P)-dependent oxidoreductase [Qipengyuania flava]|uniref:NAD(P)-dependent oxidoreductase n=1 Tax=Qipengyuania flava TaxID=192812 RepID=UPI001CD4C507|nr:NAD(P)H-binding protein [Qipengyuania flava]MCA0891245.1 NAD(P)H-binding protein [Qipengyuania flava]
MRILVIGATGGTGRKIVDELLSNGEEVTALVRSPGEGEPLPAEVTVVGGDALDAHAIGRALVGCDGAISALGPKCPSSEHLAQLAA